MNEIKFTIPGKPMAWQRARSHGKIRFDSLEQCRNKLTIGQIGAAAMDGQPMFEGPLEVTVRAMFPWPKGMSKRKRQAFGAHYCCSQKDLDNICKLLGDALNEIVWRDDRQIVKLHASKLYSDFPQTVVVVATLTEEVVE
jgi:Holliday junction resolvase RusA-like endonuclease